MKKCISFLLLISIICNLFFTMFNFSYAVETVDNIQVKNTNFDKKSIKYLAVFIKFSDNNNIRHIDDPKCIENANKIFNSEELFEMNSINGVIKVPSFKKYYEMQSYGKLSITTEIFPQVNDKVVSYQDQHPIGYYLKYSDTNPIGYKDKVESLKRETELVNNAVGFVSNQIENMGITADEVDTENDGVIDAISFFVEGQKNLPSSIAWGELLWSHKLDNMGITNKILNKRVEAYNLIYVNDYEEVAGTFSLNKGTYGTIIHEFGHTLGFMDLYRHGTPENKPVGFYDIMGSYSASNPPNFLTYFVSDYRVQTNWHKPLQVINETTNNITLFKPEFKDDNEMRAIKIKQYSNSEEYFIVEYHEKQNTYDTYSADMSGIVVYRVNDKCKYSGNTYGGDHGENDHIFVFRPNETALGDGKGDLSKATLNNVRNILGKKIETTDDSFSKEAIYYSNGSNSGIVIEVIAQNDNSVTFNVIFPKLDGDGTKEKPYLIYDVKDFFYLMKSETKNKYYKLMADLDFAGIDNYPKIDFKGNLDGNNKTIKNISSVGTGVFNDIGDYDISSVIENLNVENINIEPSTGNYIGGLANSSDNVTIKNIHLKSGYVKNIRHDINDISSTGGFIGRADNKTIIDNCSTSLDVSAEKNVGGFVGLNLNAIIKNSYMNGNVNGKSNVGGFIGLQYISDSTYNVPENVYFNFSKNGIQNAVGGCTLYHNLAALPETELGKGIVGISILENINLNISEEMEYNVTTSPVAVLPFSITSSDSTVVTYNNNKIQGLKSGKAKIFVELKVGTQNMRMESNINVENNSSNIEILSISINKTNISLNENEMEQVYVIFNPTNHTMTESINWVSSNPNVASVNGNGEILAKSVGTATITATTVNGKSANCLVTVSSVTTNVINEEDVLNYFGLTKKEGYVEGFKLSSNVSDLIVLLSSYPNVKLSSFTNSYGNEISSGVISTNMKFSLEFNQKTYNYIVVIKGDVNGDGLIYATDYVKIKNHIMGKQKLEGAYLRAADVNNDNNIYATDYVKIKNYIMGKGTI